MATKMKEPTRKQIKIEGKFATTYGLAGGYSALHSCKALGFPLQDLLLIRKTFAAIAPCN